MLSRKLLRRLNYIKDHEKENYKISMSTNKHLDKTQYLWEMHETCTKHTGCAQKSTKQNN